MEKVKIVTFNANTGEVSKGVCQQIASTEDIWRANLLSSYHKENDGKSFLSAAIGPDNFLEPYYEDAEDSNSGMLVFVTSNATECNYSIKGTRQTKTFGSAVYLTAQRGFNEFSVGRWKVSIDQNNELGIKVVRSAR